MMLEDSRLNVFLTLCQTGSFTEAANGLGITQPAVSQTIAELEKLLGAKLFNRGRGEGVSLTDQGRLFRRYAVQIQHWYHAASKAFEPGAEPELPATIPLTDSSQAEFWSCDGEIHISINNKPNQ